MWLSSKSLAVFGHMIIGLTSGVGNTVEQNPALTSYREFWNFNIIFQSE